MAKAFSVFRACVFCSQPFKPESRKTNREFYVCPSPECQEKLEIYNRLIKSRTALLQFIKNMEMKKHGTIE